MRLGGCSHGAVCGLVHGRTGSIVPSPVFFRLDSITSLVLGRATANIILIKDPDVDQDHARAN